MMALLRDTITSFEDNRAIKVVVIRHEGKVFSSGHDLKEIDLQQSTTGTTEPIFALCSSLMLAVRGARFPVIAEVGGLATAGGCQLVAACETSSACSPLSRDDAPRTSKYVLKSSCAFVWVYTFSTPALALSLTRPSIGEYRRRSGGGVRYSELFDARCQDRPLLHNPWGCFGARHAGDYQSKP
jgi:hypothetical protein